MMPTLRALRRMLSSDIKPLKAGLQEKTQSSLILCVTWHLFGAAFLLHRVWGGIQIEGGDEGLGGWGWGALAGQLQSKWFCEEDPSAVIRGGAPFGRGCRGRRTQSESVRAQKQKLEEKKTTKLLAGLPSR